MPKTYTRPSIPLDKQVVTRARKLSDKQVTIERKSRRKFIASNGGR